MALREGILYWGDNRSNIFYSDYGSTVRLLVKRIRVNEETRKKLFANLVELEARLRRRVTYDEAISILLDGSRDTREARIQFAKLFGALKKGKRVWKELRDLRREEKSRLEGLANSA